MLDAARWIDTWVDSYDWRVGIANDNTTVERELAHLKELAATGARYQPDPAEWNLIRMKLERHTQC